MNRLRAGAWLLLALAILSAGSYLLGSWRTAGLGYPLDDAWIYQTYARNLAERGEWAFLPGQPSAGSTGPLWAGALAVGRWLGLEPRLWTYALGIGLLGLTAILCAAWLRNRHPERPAWGWVAGLVVLTEWHLVWASVSGMETLALACLGAAVFWAMERPGTRPIGIGLLIGVGVWIRPDALLLLAPALLGEALRGRRLGGTLSVAAGAALAVAPYLAFNRLLSGEWWPTTFYAKQAEYAALRLTPLVQRLASQAVLPLVGVGAVLLLGVGASAARALRARAWARLLPLVWIIGHLCAYALRLPVTYQHGRYAIPVIPALLVLGLDGMAGWARLTSPARVPRLLSRTWAATLAGVALVFWGLGARAYATDVAVIETEMVRAARWVAEHTERGAAVAAHDIGALGYFGERRLIDLAGLISPQVIPILRDEPALRAYLDASGAEYLVTFPGWYPELTRGARPLFVTAGRYSPSEGGENMAVYRWPSTPP